MDIGPAVEKPKSELPVAVTDETPSNAKLNDESQEEWEEHKEQEEAEGEEEQENDEEAAAEKEEHQQQESSDEKLRHAMADPEILQILNDPLKASFLPELVANPRGAEQAMEANPELQDAVVKLLVAGVIRMPACGGGSSSGSTGITARKKDPAPHMRPQS